MTILHEPTTARTAEVTLPVNLTVELEPTADGRIAVDVYDESLDPTGTLALDPAWRIRLAGGHEQAADALRTLADALLRAADAEDLRTLARPDRDDDRPAYRITGTPGRYQWEVYDPYRLTGVASTREEADRGAREDLRTIGLLRRTVRAVALDRIEVDGTVMGYSAAVAALVGLGVDREVAEDWLDYLIGGGQ